MATIIDPPNSVWPNGLKVDSEGYVTFYPLGTNKVDITTITWPKGDKLVSPFVYESNKLVGFVDTEALITSDNTMIYLPYEHIETEFSAINKGELQIHAPKATTKKASWKNSEKEDIPEAQFKYKGCSTVDNVKTVDANYLTTDIVDGTWSEPLWDLTDGKDAFRSCTNLTSFTSDLPSLTNGDYMFYYCDNLTSFSSDLSSLTNGHCMFLVCGNLTTFTSDLSSLENSGSMFADCYKLTTFSSDLSSLTNGEYMFYDCHKLESFTTDLPNLTNGSSMFIRCWNLSTFASDSNGSPVNLSSLTNGYNMFQSCTNLTSFNSDLSSLTNGSNMFCGCTNLTTFPFKLPSLTNGDAMFIRCTNLTSFNGDLSSLTYGDQMFSRCSNLTSFNSDLSSLTNGWGMFNETPLTSFSGDLSSLANGYKMFYECKLTPQSVMYIVESIRNITEEKAKYTSGEIPWVTYDSETEKYSAPFGFMEDGSYVYTYNNPDPYTTTISASDVGLLTLGIDVTNNADTIEQQLQTFAEGCLCDSWEELKQKFVDKGWTVAFQYGGTTDEIPNTYDLRSGGQIIPCPIFAKLIEADKDSAEYCTEDASKFYNIEWGHDVTDTSSYTQFNSLEEAVTHFNIKPVERN